MSGGDRWTICQQYSQWDHHCVLPLLHIFYVFGVKHDGRGDGIEMSGATHPVLISQNLSFTEFINLSQSSNRANGEKSSRVGSWHHQSNDLDQMFGLLELSSQCEIISVSARKLLCEFLLVPGQYSAHNKVWYYLCYPGHRQPQIYFTLIYFHETS